LATSPRHAADAADLADVISLNSRNRYFRRTTQNMPQYHTLHRTTSKRHGYKTPTGLVAATQLDTLKHALELCLAMGGG
jgi:hypothetical protein